MGTRNRMTAARCCCGGCAYQAADGNAWGPDPFDALDLGWINRYPLFDTFTADGTLRCATAGNQSGTWSTLYRTASIAPANLRVIVEAQVYPQAASATMGVFFVEGNSFRLFARWRFGNFGLYAFGSYHVVTRSAQAGDKLTVKVEHVAGYQHRACYFVNGELVHQATGLWTFGRTEWHGVACTTGTAELPAVIGQWDNYACHVGNP